LHSHFRILTIQKPEALNQPTSATNLFPKQKTFNMGVLTVTVVKATNLADKDMLGKTDAYVKLGKSWGVRHELPDCATSAEFSIQGIKSNEP